jgi:hypothetical protein
MRWSGLRRIECAAPIQVDQDVSANGLFDNFDCPIIKTETQPRHPPLDKRRIMDIRSRCGNPAVRPASPSGIRLQEKGAKSNVLNTFALKSFVSKTLENKSHVLKTLRLSFLG